MDYDETKIKEGLHELLKHRLNLIKEDVEYSPGDLAHNRSEYSKIACLASSFSIDVTEYAEKLKKLVDKFNKIKGVTR